MPPSQAADAIEEVEPGAAVEILGELSSDDRADVLGEVAGGLMHTEFVSVAAADSVAFAIDLIRSSAENYARYSIQYLYAVDIEGRLERVVPLRGLLLAPPTARRAQS